MPHPALHRRGVLTAATLAVVVALTSSGAHLSAQPSNGDPLIQDLRWRNIGNANLVGRISSVDALESDWAHVVVASASGGVFKSKNGGITWDAIFDQYAAASIGDVKINQTNPDIIWVGTGEECGRNSAAWGDGVYKSTDGGATFENVGLADTFNIGKIALHPKDVNTVYVAAIGNIYGPVGSRGLFKTTDGGKTWNKLTDGLPNDPQTGAIDMVMDPSNPDILYVSFWQRIRYPWRLNSGGPNSGLFKSTNGGRSWRKLTNTLPQGDMGKIGLAIARSNPKVVMAHIEHGFQPSATIPAPGQPAAAQGGRGGGGTPNPEYTDMTKLGAGIYRSENGGDTWTFLDRYLTRPFYYNHIGISPLDDKYVFSYNIAYRRSRDGGKTFVGGGGGNGGHCWHAMWHDPHNKNRYYIGSDGGLNLTHDDGATDIRFENLNVTQYYAISADMREPYYVCGGLQDAGSSCGPSATRAQGIYLSDWFNISGGDGYHTQQDPTNYRNIYSESQPDRQGGNIGRSDAETRQRTNVRPSKTNITNWDEYITPEMEKKADAANWGVQPAQMGPLRYNWSTPFILSPHNPRAIMIGSNHLIMSLDGGASYRLISPDLTQNDPERTSRLSGGMTPDENPGGGAEYHATIITISESLIEPGQIWIGTDDGNIQVTRDYGKSWAKVGTATLPGNPRPDIWVSRVEASKHTNGTAFATVTAHRFAIYKPFVYKTTDFGKTWTNITNNLPDGHPMYVVKQDTTNPDLLFAGSEFAAFYSVNGGQSWQRLNNNMPTVAVHDLLIHPRDGDLIAGTHGRGLWIMDDISPLQQLTAEVQKAPAHLFQSPVATQWLAIQPQHNGGEISFVGQNPSRNARIAYHLGRSISGEVRVEVSDITGRNTCAASFPAREGINRIEWAMRWNPPGGVVAAPAGPAGAGGGGGRGGGAPAACLVASNQAAAPAGRGGGGGGGRGGGGGGQIEPGTYKVTLTAGGQTYVSSLTVRRDPLLNDMR